MLNGAELVKRGEEQWDSARAAWNLAIDQRPADGGTTWQPRRGRCGGEFCSRERLAGGRAGPRLRLPALRDCLEALAGEARALDASVHMPSIGTGQGATRGRGCAT